MDGKVKSVIATNMGNYLQRNLTFCPYIYYCFPLSISRETFSKHLLIFILCVCFYLHARTHHVCAFNPFKCVYTHLCVHIYIYINIYLCIYSAFLPKKASI